MFGVGRWEPDARQRLQRSAMTLFRERGYDNVTVAEIAEHAGLTRRSFFNHFSDKREIFFAGAAAFQADVIRHLDEVDAVISPLGAAVEALTAAGGELGEYRAFAPAVRALIGSSPELRERDLAKMAAVGDALIEGLTRRDVPARQAVLAARLAVLAFDIAWQDWIDHPADDFADVMHGAVRQTRDVLGDAPRAPLPMAREGRPELALRRNARG